MPGFDSLQGLGVGAGVASGLASGLDAYVKTRSSLQEEAIKKKLANAQSIEAYSKLADAVGTDQANPIAQKLGLLPETGPPAGFLPPAQKPVAPTPDGSSPGSNPGGAAPHSSTNIDDSKALGMLPAQTNGPDVYSLDPAAFGREAARQPRAAREAMMARYSKEYEQHTPQAQAALTNTTNEPTEKLANLMKEYHDRTDTVARNFVAINKALDSGGPRSMQTVINLLPEMFRAGGRPGEIPSDFISGTDAKGEIADAFTKAKEGTFSPSTIRAIKEQMAILYEGQRNAWQARVRDMGGALKGANGAPNRLSSLDQADKYFSQTNRTPSPHGGRSGDGGEIPSASAADGMADPETGHPLDRLLLERAGRRGKRH